MKRNIIEFLITVFSIIGAILVGTKTDLTSLDTLADIALTVSTFVCWAFSSLTFYGPISPMRL